MTDNLPQHPVEQSLADNRDGVIAQADRPTVAPALQKRAVTPASTGDLSAAARETDGQTRRRRRRQRLREIQEGIERLAAVNRDNPSGVYAGYRFVRLGARTLPSEEPYLGAFLPLKVARRYPMLLDHQSLEGEEVFDHERLPAGTRVATRPGKFRTLRRDCLARRANSRRAYLIAALTLLTLVAASAVALFGAG